MELDNDVLGLVIAGLAFVVSVISYWLSRKNSITNLRPVLVFTYDGRQGWILKNAGNGPALNVIVAQKKNNEWFNPVRVPPIPTNSEFLLEWLDHVNDTGLGTNYSDFNNRPYSSTCGNDLSKAFNKSTLPNWKENEIGRHWNHPKYTGGAKP